MPGGLFRWAAPLFARGDKHWTEANARAFTDLLAPFLPANGRLLDLGGGTGTLAALMARLVPCTVTVLDSSPNMLRYASDLPGVEPVLGDAASIPFPDDTFDAALVCDAFHHFAAPEAAAGEMARVVRPDGGVVLFENDAGARATRLIGRVEKLLGEPGGFLCPAEMEALMSAAGVQGSSRRRSSMSYVFVGRVIPPAEADSSATG